MIRLIGAGVVGLVLLAANGVVSGLWSHRFESWSDDSVQATLAQLERVPMEVGDWKGTRTEAHTYDFVEEEIGRGVAIRYRRQADGAEVVAYVGCGPTFSVIAHCPTVCYPGGGYTWLQPDTRTTLDLGEGKPGATLWVSQFSREMGEVPVYLRVFWGFTDGTEWRIPSNGAREYRRSPLIYKCYLVRAVTTPDEPVEGDPALQLGMGLLPELDKIFGR